MAGTKDSFSHRKRSSFICKIFSLFLPCNMAAVQNLYWIVGHFECLNDIGLLMLYFIPDLNGGRKVKFAYEPGRRLSQSLLREATRSISIPPGMRCIGGFASTHLYTWVERADTESSVLSQNTVQRPQPHGSG